MFASSSVVVLLSAAAVMANSHQEARSHKAIARRMNSTSTVDKRDENTNVRFTWYPTDTGPDACTGKNHLSTDWYVAMGTNQYADGSGCCGRQLRLDYNGKSTVATCVDECATCPGWGELDLTEGLFEFFVGDPGIGVFYGSWSYADDTTTTTTSTHTSTSTTHKTTSTSTAKPTSTAVVEKVEVSTTHTSSAKPSSSSSKKASSSSAKPSSSASTSSTATSETTALPTATEAVGNVGSGVETTAAAVPLAGALSGSGTSGVAALAAPKLVAALAVVAIAAIHAL
ncbi:hypothetical protein DFH07DRAFT_936249 [Mycena maculata]|uniref:Uncharacterized protein n=1 Tax=Mycena maculata TaxID=230809 RepID=A0AAD7NX42_9AGAR|nr:hypothetical protein DFH07DRAFT_936249 [Mycena maculata]